MKKILSLIAVLTPSLALAQNTAPIYDANGLTTKLIGIGNTIIYLLVALAVIFIVWNVVMFFIKGDSEVDRKASGMNILWGIVGLFVILSIWGLVNILVGTFRTNPVNNPVPTLPTSDRPIIQ